MKTPIKSEYKNTPYTPGPWEISDKSDWLVVGYDPRLYPENERCTVARSDPAGDRIDTETGIANAKLISAAPELLEALRDMLAYAEDSVEPPGRPNPHLIARARAAVEKAGL